jgi:hypothetical protein
LTVIYIGKVKGYNCSAPVYARSSVAAHASSLRRKQ